jgi:hypothetical protein
VPCPGSGEAWTTQQEAFGRYFVSRSELHATLSRHAADDPLVGEIVDDALSIPRGNVPLRLYGAVHYLVLAGRAPAYADAPDPWPPFRAILEEHRDWLREFVVHQPVQTNEPRRCWTLLPGMLMGVGGWEGPVDLLELGPSGGLNLLWDRHRYEYRHGSWGGEEARLVLAGVEHAPVPPAVLEPRPLVRKRIGVDRLPVDVGTEHGALLLQAFTWADQPERRERVRTAIELARAEPPTLIEADFVELLPELLAARDPDSLTLVFDSHSTEYLEDDAYRVVERAIERAAVGGGPLTWVSVELPRAEGAQGFVLEVRAWPGGHHRRIADVHYHGEDLRWLAA